MPLKFHFRLRPIEDIEPWGREQGEPQLHWFGLTDGWFWIEVDGQELFRYSDAVQHLWALQSPQVKTSPSPYEEYYIARYWEDLLEILPNIMDPLPADLAVRVADAEAWQNWQSAFHDQWEQSDNEAAWDIYALAIGWWSQRTWDAGHLAHPPRLWFWRVADTIHIHWDNRAVMLDGTPVWAAFQGEAVLSVTEFKAAAESFHDRFMTEMERRVEAAVDAWPRPDVKIDTTALLREQVQRAGWLEPALNPASIEIKRESSWDVIRAALEHVETFNVVDTAVVSREGEV